MLKLSLRLAALLIAFSPFSLSASGPSALEQALSSEATASWLGDLRIPEPRKPAPAVQKGDFTGIPDYAFGYLNDVTVKLIDASRSAVEISLFSVNLKDAPDALLRARDRGVKVRVIINESHVFSRPSTEVKKLLAATGIEVRTLRGTRSYGVNHNKIGVFDRSVATFGSYNWTFGATFSSLENLLVARHPVYVDGYIRYFDWMWSKARKPELGPSPEVPVGYYGEPPQDPAPAQSLNGTRVPAYLFSPGSDTENRLAAILDAARRTIDAVTFTFSSKPLADALIRAKQRGVKVRFMMDEEMARDSFIAKYTFDNGVPFRVRRGRTEKGALHNKFAILDGEILATGSFNWTTNASVNSFENVAFVSDAGALKAYQSSFNWFHSSSTAPTSDFFQPEPFNPEPPPAPAD